MLALGDALAMVLLEARGFTKEDFARFHPGGMIGRSMFLRVYQIMRPRNALAMVATDTPISAVLKTMTNSAPAPPLSPAGQPASRHIYPRRFCPPFQSDTRIAERLVAT